MNQPTQEDFQAWKETHPKWKNDEPTMAWVYLCDVFNETDWTREMCYSSRCCANKNRCQNAEEVVKCRDRKTPEIKIIIEKIDTLVKEFVQNGNIFPKPKGQDDRIKMVLEDLYKTPQGVD